MISTKDQYRPDALGRCCQYRNALFHVRLHHLINILSVLDSVFFSFTLELGMSCGVYKRTLCLLPELNLLEIQEMMILPDRLEHQ